MLTAMNGTDSLVIGRSYLSNESGSLTFWTECAKQEVSLIASMEGSTAIRTTRKRSTYFTAVRNVTGESVRIHGIDAVLHNAIVTAVRERSRIALHQQCEHRNARSRHRQ